jgi:transposase
VPTTAEQPPFYEELALALVERDARLARQAHLIRSLTRDVAERDARLAVLEAAREADAAKLEALESLVGELAAKLGRDSRTSSKPPGSDGPASRAERRSRQKELRREERQAQGDGVKRKKGGQPGHAGRGLELTPNPDARIALEPGSCSGCGAGLAGAAFLGARLLQVIDIPEVRALTTEYRLAARRCACGRVTRAEAPAGAVGAPVCYGPNLSAAAAFLHAHGHTSQERAAELVGGLYGVGVSTGWIGKVASRLAATLTGFEADLKTALLAEPVLLGDETPVNTAEDSPDADEAIGADGDRGQERAFHPHVFTIRSASMVWLGAGHTRGHAALDAFGLLARYTGTLVSDDYNGYAKYEKTLTARQLCNQHLIRSARGVHGAEPKLQEWATRVVEAMRAGRRAVEDTLAKGGASLTDEQIAALEDAYTTAAEAGVARNLHRRTSTGAKHPAWILAQRFLDKKDQVLHHLRDFKVPWTSNLAEQALRGVKIHLKISGCFRTLATTRAYCRIHSYLATTRLHRIPPMTAIRAALAGHAWSPLTPDTT